MIRDQDRYRLFTRRAVLLAGGKLGLLSALVGRMYYLQILEADKYRTLADDNRINLRLLAPRRGRILDRTGVPLAVNRQTYRVILVRERSAGVAATLDRLARIIALTDEDRRRVLHDARHRPAFAPITVREDLDWDEVARIEINTPDLPGVQIEVGDNRYYPFGAAAAHLIGYVGAVTEAELAKGDEPLLALPSFRIGKSGIEKVYDMRLRGRAGRSEVEVNAVGRTIRELSRDEGTPGDDLHLNIDSTLQAFAHSRLGDQSGAVVMLDVRTGDVLVLASAPAFDPNAFAHGISHKYWNELIHNERAPLTDKAVAGQYAPGSTFKPVVALAGLQSGAITPDHRVFCGGYVELGNRRFHCWRHWGHGWLDLRGALQHSCDVYFYDVARRTGVDTISAMGRRFGMGAELGIDLTGEKPGLMPTRAWKRAAIGKPWQLGETLVTGIGQGFVLATPLQLAVLAARLANGRHAVSPGILSRGESHDPRPRPAAVAPLGLPADALEVVRGGMFDVCNTIHGTAYRARIKQPGWEMAGKSGTAQVRRITMAERADGVKKNDELPWRERDHALFIAFAPFDAPRYAIATVVAHGGGGSSVAAPICRDVLIEALKRDPAATPPVGTSWRTGPGRLARADGAGAPEEN